MNLHYTLKTLFITLIALSLFGCNAINEELPTYEETSLVWEGDVAPDFTITLLRGEEVTLSSLRGEVVLLTLFTHTCPDCKMLFDDLMLSKADIDSLGVKMLAISRGGTAEEIESYIESNGYDFLVGADPTADIFYTLYATAYVPRCYLINKQGIIDTATIEYDESYIPRFIQRMKELVKE